MKKVLFVLAITALTACGEGITPAEKAPVDTTSLGKDTTTGGGGVQVPTEDKTIDHKLEQQ